MQSRRGLAAILLIAACGPSGRDNVDGGVMDTGNMLDGETCEDLVDVVFVLDTSSSMDFVLTKLEQQISQVVSATNMLAADSHFGLIVFQDNHFIDNTGQLDSGVVHTNATSLQSAFAKYRSVYTNNNRNPGDGAGGPIDQNPICEENSLDALYATAQTFPWRDNATRVVILATDDTFIERPDNYGDRDGDGDTTSTDFPREGNYPALRTMAETVTALQTAKVRVFSFSRSVVPSFLSRCGTPRRYAWEDISDGWSTPYKGQEPIPNRTDGRNFDLDKVKDGTLSLAETINNVVLDSHCNPILL